MWVMILNRFWIKSVKLFWIDQPHFMSLTFYDKIQNFKLKIEIYIDILNNITFLLHIQAAYILRKRKISRNKSRIFKSNFLWKNSIEYTKFYCNQMPEHIILFIFIYKYTVSVRFTHWSSSSFISTKTFPPDLSKQNNTIHFALRMSNPWVVSILSRPLGHWSYKNYLFRKNH